MQDDLKIQGEVSLSAEGAENALDRVGDRSGKMATRLQTEADKAGRAVDGIGTGAGKNAEQFTRAESRISDSIKRTTKNLETLGKTASQKMEIQISEKGLDASKFEPALKKLRELEAAQNSVNTSAKKIPSAYDDITRSLGGMVTAAAALAAVGGSVSKLVSIQREFDVLNASLVTMTGSAKNAGIAFSALQGFAATTPFSLQEVTTAFVKLKSLGLEPSQRALESYGNTASAMGKSLEQFIEAVADASTGEFERLKEFGIKASKSGDQVSLTFQGITTTIKNSSDQITEYLTKIGENQFAGAMAERAKTLDGAISNLSDSWNNLFLTVNQNATGTLIYDTVSLASGAVSDLTKIINAMTVAADENANSVGAMATVQDGIRTTFEAVAVVGANVAYVFKAIGTEIGGLAAQAAAVAQGDFASAGAIGDMMKEDAKKAREEIDALSERILAAGKVATVTSKSLDDLVAKAGSAVARSGSAAGSSTAKQISDYARLVASIKEKISVQNIELATGEKANEGEKLRAQIIEQTLSGQLKLTAAQKDSVLAMAAELDAKISVAAANKEIAAAQEKFTADAMKSAESIYKQAAEQEKANAVFGKAKSSVQELTLAEMERALQMQLMSGEYVPGLVDAMESQIDAQKRLIAAMQEGENLETGKKMAEESKKAAEDTAKEWQKTADKINDSLTDALMRGFENGKGFAENMRDTVVNMFKTMVLRPMVSAIVSPVAGGMTTLVNGGSASSGYAGLANYAGLASSMSGLYSTGVIGAQWAAGTMSGANALGSIYANAVGGGLDALLATNAAYGTAAAGTAAAGTAAAGTAAATAAGSGAGTGASTGMLGSMASMWPLAVIIGMITANKLYSQGISHETLDDEGAGGRLFDLNAVYGTEILTKLGISSRIANVITGAPLQAALYKMISGETRGGGSYAWGSSTMNGAAGTYDDVTYIHGPSGGEIASDSVKEAIASTIGGINDVLKSVGSSLTLAGFQAALETSSKGRGGVLAGGTLSDGTTFGEAGTGNNYAGTYYESWSTQDPDAETAMKNLATDLQQATLQALKAAADVPKSVKNIIGDIDIEAMTADETTALLTSVSTFISSVNILRTTLEYLPISNLQDATFAVIGSLSEIAGGVDALTTSIDSYYQTYYSESERMDAASEQLDAAFTALGYTMPETKDAFRALVDGMDLTTESGQQSYLSLLALSASFAQVADYADQAAEAAQSAAQALADEMQSWQDRLDVLTGAATETEISLRNDLAAATDEAVRALIQQVYAQEALAASASATTDAVAAARDVYTGAIDAAYTALERSVSAQKSALQEAYTAQSDALADAVSSAQSSVSSAQELKSALASLVSSLASAVADTALQTNAQLLAQRAAAQSSLDIALSAAASGVSLTGYSDSIATAISAMSADAAGAYSDYQDYAFDQARASSSLSALGALAGDQLSVADMQVSIMRRTYDQAVQAQDAAQQAYDQEIDALDALLSDAQSQIDALNGIDASVLSVADSINLLDATMQQYAAAISRLAEAEAAAPAASAQTQIEALYQSLLGRSSDAAGMAYWVSMFESGVMSIAQIAASIKLSGEYTNSHAGGLEAVPYDGYRAILHKGEAVVDSGSVAAIRRYFDADVSSAGSNDEIRQLREDQRAQSAAMAGLMARMAKVLEKWDYDGQPETRSYA